MSLETIVIRGRAVSTFILLAALIKSELAASFDLASTERSRTDSGFCLASHPNQPMNGNHTEDQVIVLPGFTAIDMRRTVASLCERSYEWESDYPPNQIKSSSEWLI